MTLDTHEEFTIFWCEGAYLVTTPMLQEARVVPKERLDAANDLLRKLATVCRECNDEMGFMATDVPLADFILWGKLLPPEALGPKCYDHAVKYVGHHTLAGHGDRFMLAAVDLRPINRALGLL